MTSTSRCDVFGVDCFAGDLEQAAALVLERARDGGGGFASLMNVHVAMTAQRDPALGAALGDAWKVFPDGAPIAWVQRRGGAIDARRVAGPDLMLTVLRRGRDLRHLLFGSTPDVVRRLRDRVTSSIPGIEIVGAISPARGQEHDPETIREISRGEADIVWVALGAPKQELWARRHAAELAPALLLGVGAAFDFHAGTKPRAPHWMQRSGLEWLHRLVHEPRRLGWRYLSTNFRFTVAALRQTAQV